ncbi:MAG TPA: hypothetical protein VKT80_14840 [Chloroflexota bacterium]|nr:hypothetical protein [Chloroflexota bacterium]
MTTLLLSPFHDSESRQLPIVRRLIDPNDPLSATWHRALANYAGALAVPSPATDPRSIEALRAAGWDIASGVDGVDRGLWRMVDLALERPVDRVHFCDLDRLLHWLIRFPNELHDLPSFWADNDLTVLARSERAFQSHPGCQVLTEGIANYVIARRTGIAEIDAFSGSYVWSRRAAKAVLAAPGPRDLRFYAEAVMAPYRSGCSVGCRIVEGLEWETPDQYPDKIAALGFAAWLADFESPAQWRHRAELARVFVEAALS